MDSNSRKRKLPEWMLSPVKSEDKVEEDTKTQSLRKFFKPKAKSNENKRQNTEKPVVYIMSPKELKEVALEMLAESEEEETA